MLSSGPTVLVLDLSQAQIALQHVAADTRIIAFTPEASLFLEKKGFDVIRAENLVSAFTHARNVVTLHKMLQRIHVQLSDGRLHAAEILSHKPFLFNLLGPVLLMRAILSRLGAGPFTIIRSGHLRSAETPTQALWLLAEEVRPNLRQFTSLHYSRLHGRLAQGLGRWVVKSLPKGPMISHIDFGNPVPRRLVALVEKVQPDAVITYARPPRRTMLDSIVRAIRSKHAALRGKGEVHLFRATAKGTSCAIANDEFDFISSGQADLDPIIRAALKDHATIARAEVEAGAAFARDHKPKAVILDNLVFPATIRAAMDLSAKGTRILMVNHGSHSLPSDPISKLAALLWADQGRVTAPFVTDLICKTPQVAQVAGCLSNVKQPVHPLPIYARPKRDATRNAHFTIVHAGNFMPARTHIPWLTELPGEYMQGILDLAEAVTKVDDIKLIIKIKAQKDGLPIEWMEEQIAGLGAGERVVIDSKTPLPQLFPRTDLLVSNLSTTIEEALTCHVPVLLNTWRRHYNHLPASHEPPNAQGRNAVYCAKNKEDLPRLLEAIKQHHQSPLSENETQGLVWCQQQFCELPTFAQDILK